MWLVLCSTGLPAAARAELLTLKQGAALPLTEAPYAGTEDTSIEAISISWVGTNAGQNFGGREDLSVGRNVQFGFFGPLRSLIRFDVSPLRGRSAEVSSVTLKLYVRSVFFSGVDGTNVLVYRLAPENEGWIEGENTAGELGGPPDDGLATWNQKVQGLTSWWGSAGASSSGVDFLTPEVASRAVDGSTPAGVALEFVMVGPAAAALVRDWVGNDHAGLLIKAQDDTYHSNSAIVRFWSSEAPDPALRPELIIEYTPRRTPVPAIPLLLLDD